jgi:DNA/RNA-binding domain of Phe-tRNA-synthetase-like protein
MEIKVSQDIKNLLPNFKVGIIQYSSITVSESPQMLKGRLQLFQESIYFDLEDKPVTDIKGIQEWRTIFKKVGTDPSRYRPSVEALYRRIKKQDYLHTINSAADLNNFFSLQYEVPIGIYDLDKINGAIELRVGKSGDEYTGINGRLINMENKLLTSDTTGPFGSPFVDSERTAVTEASQNAVQVIYLKPSLSVDQCEKLVQSLMDMFTQVNGGTGHFTILS